MVNYINTLKLTLDADAEGPGTAKDVSCQGTNIALIPEVEGGETVSTFCGAVQIPGVVRYTLHIEGLQDYGQVDGVCEILHAAYKRGADSDPNTTGDVDYELTVGKAIRRGTVNVAQDVEFGGGAGSALTFTVDLPTTGAPEDDEVAA